jgi:hypothetical protein
LTFHTPKRTFVPSSQAVKVRQVLRRRTRVDFVYAARKPLRVDTNLRSGDNIQGLVNSLGAQFLSLLLLAIPVASIAWTITHEDLFREPRDYCKRMSESRAKLWQRKFFYLFTCEYCFSHYVAAAFLVITRFKLVYPDWRGFLVSLFALVWVSNVYMAIFANLRLDVHHERLEIKSKDMDLQSKAEQNHTNRAA